MPRESRDAKADRLIRAGCVEVLTAVSDEQWSAIVEGDTDTYLVERTPEGRYCECSYGAERRCSHYIAGEAVAFGRLAMSERSSA